MIENHVNVLRPTTSKIDLALMVRVLSTPTLDAVTRCVSGSVALSAYELMALPMPSEETITEWAELNDTDLNRVVAQAYRPRGA